MQLDSSKEHIRFVVSTGCPECLLVVSANKELQSVDILLVSSHELIIYDRSWKGRLKRALDSLLGRYYDNDWVTLSAEDARKLAKTLESAARFVED